MCHVSGRCAITHNVCTVQSGGGSVITGAAPSSIPPDGESEVGGGHHGTATNSHLGKHLLIWLKGNMT